MTNEEYLNQALEFRREAEEGNRPVFKRMSKAERFKVGKQWDNEVLEYNKARRKHSLTINKILPTVLQIEGVQIQNKKDITARPRLGSSAHVAKVLTAEAKHAMDDSNANHETSSVLSDGVATARGWIGLDVDFSQDPARGNLLIKKREPFMVLPDPTRTAYDLNDPKGGAKYIIEDEWIDKDLLELQYPSKKNSLMSTDYSVGRESSRFASIINFLFSRSDIPVQDDYRDTSKDEKTLTSKSKFNYRLSRTWWKEWVKGAYLYRSDNPFDYLTLTKPSQISEAKRIIDENPDAARLVEKDRKGKPLVVPILNVTLNVGDVFLENIRDPFDGMHLFPIVPYCPYFVNGYEFGVVENLIGPQETLNWSFSNFVNNMKNLANSGWKVRKLLGKYGDFLQSHSGEDGIIVEEAKAGGKIEKLEPTQVDKGALIITEQTSQHLAEIANIRLENPTFDEKNMSGRAILLKQQAALTGSATLFGNWDYTLQLLGKLVIETICHLNLYSDDEVRAIIDEEDLVDAKLMDEARRMVVSKMQEMGVSIPQPPEPLNEGVFVTSAPGAQKGMLGQFQQEKSLFEQVSNKIEQLARPIAIQMLLDEVKNIKKNRYTVKIDQSPMAPTTRIAAFAELLDLNKILIESRQLPVDRESLIEASDLPDKEKIIERGKQQMAAMAGARK